MAKSFDDLVEQTSNDNTKQIAEQRTRKLLGEHTDNPVVKIIENDNDGSLMIEYDEKHPAFAHLVGKSDEEITAFFTEAINRGLDEVKSS